MIFNPSGALWQGGICSESGLIFFVGPSVGFPAILQAGGKTGGKGVPHFSPGRLIGSTKVVNLD